jgi:hypothetical protein
MVDFRVKSRPGVSGFVDPKRFSLGRLLLKRTTAVYPLFHDCRSLEYDHATRRDRYIDARLGISAHRRPFLCTVNVPNDDNFTASPRAMLSLISSSTSSTKAEDSVRDSPTFR